MRSLIGVLASAPTLVLLGLAANRSCAEETEGPATSNKAVVFYVSPKGNDAWSGRLCVPNPSHTDGPFASLMRARDASRKLGMDHAVRIVVRGGRYFLQEALVLDQRDSGSRYAPRVWAAYAKETPVVSGGVPTAGWTPFRGRILEADLPERRTTTTRLRSLFCDGTRMVRARTPNRDRANPLYGGWAFMQGTAGDDAFKYSAGLFDRPLSKPGQADVFTFVGPNGGFGSEILPVTSIDAKARVIHTRTARGRDPIVGFSENCRFIVENAIECLDEPAEWCVDAEAGKLYFWPPVGFSLKSQVVAPVLPTLLILSRAKWISIAGLTFTETAEDGRGSVRCEGCDQIAFRNNRFVGLGGRGLEILGRERTTSRVTVERNEFADTGRSGLYLGGSVRDCDVVDNDVHHCGVFDKYSAGIEFPFYGGSATDVGPQSYTDRIRIAHNVVHDLPRDGIQLGANPYGRNTVEYNRVERTALETVDAGAIRCHRVISHLQGVDHMPPMVGHVIEHNLVADTRGCGASGGRIVTPYPWPTFGIYLDEGSSQCAVRQNVVLRSGVGAIINPGQFNTLENNVFHDNNVGIFYQAVPPFDKLRPALGGNRLVHNVIVGPNANSFAYSLRDRSERTLAASDFNLFWNGKGAVRFETQTVSDKSPVVRDFDDWRRQSYDQHSTVGDPLFVAAARNDFRLQPTSPAHALGILPIDISNAGVRPVRGNFQPE